MMTDLQYRVNFALQSGAVSEPIVRQMRQDPVEGATERRAA